MINLRQSLWRYNSTWYNSRSQSSHPVQLPDECTRVIACPLAFKRVQEINQISGSGWYMSWCESRTMTHMSCWRPFHSDGEGRGKAVCVVMCVCLCCMGVCVWVCLLVFVCVGFSLSLCVCVSLCVGLSLSLCLCACSCCVGISLSVCACVFVWSRLWDDAYNYHMIITAFFLWNKVISNNLPVSLNNIIQFKTPSFFHPILNTSILLLNS